jgi:polysaccharide export outer membrane protein
VSASRNPVIRSAGPVLAYVLLMCSCAGTALSQTSPLTKIHVGDVIEVDQVGGTEFDWRGRVGPDGSLIGFETYGEAPNALCMSERELAASIEAVFSRILREPKFEVRIIDRSQRPTVTIDGAVRSPSRFSLRREVRIRELIALAGGLTDSVAGDIVINRQNQLACTGGSSASGFEQIRIRLKDLIEGREDANAEIFAGDTIVVEKASVVYIIGGVRDPGPAFVRGEDTVMAAVEKAGGFAKDAVRSDITVYRRSAGGSEIIQCGTGRESICDPSKVLVLPFDIIEVGSKGSGKRQFAPVIAGAEAVAGVSNTELPLRIIE